MKTRPTVLVTGATGFVGRSLLPHLLRDGYVPTAAVRRRSACPKRQVMRVIEVGEIDAMTDWHEALDGCQQVVHSAACVSTVRDMAAGAEIFYRVNVAGTLNLARQAARAGVRRLVFLSSIKVHGEMNTQPYTEECPLQPQGPYACSKQAAEQGLRDIAQQTGLEVVILRLPLVFGPGVAANFYRLMRCIRRGVPLPLGCVQNRRSLLYIGNLLDAISLCLRHPAAAQQSYVLADGQDVSTSGLIRLLAHDLGKHANLWSVPTTGLLWTAALLGKKEQAQRLLGSLTVDSAKIRRELGWSPPFSLNQGLIQTVQWFLEHQQTKYRP